MGCEENSRFHLIQLPKRRKVRHWQYCPPPKKIIALMVKLTFLHLFHQHMWYFTNLLFYDHHLAGTSHLFETRLSDLPHRYFPINCNPNPCFISKELVLILLLACLLNISWTLNFQTFMVSGSRYFSACRQ